MLIILSCVHVSPSDVDEFLADLRALSLTVRQRTGCLFYTAALEDASEGRLLVAERWQDQAALTAHLGAPETSAFVEKWGQRMRGEVQKYDATNGRPLAG